MASILWARPGGAAGRDGGGEKILRPAAGRRVEFRPSKALSSDRQPVTIRIHLLDAMNRLPAPSTTAPFGLTTPA
jgi:hypothetical protein